MGMQDDSQSIRSSNMCFCETPSQQICYDIFIMLADAYSNAFIGSVYTVFVVICVFFSFKWLTQKAALSISVTQRSMLNKYFQFKLDLYLKSLSFFYYYNVNLFEKGILRGSTTTIMEQSCNEPEN